MHQIIAIETECQTERDGEIKQRWIAFYVRVCGFLQVISKEKMKRQRLLLFQKERKKIATKTPICELLDRLKLTRENSFRS